MCGSSLFAASVQPDVDAQYSAVLSVMKHPSATGILVTEIGPDSPAGNAGLRAGDIIYHYAGASVHDLQTLRERVAEAFATHASGDGDPKILLGIHRGAADMVLQIPRAPLGIRAVEVEAGVPLPANPPASPRGAITLAWDDLIRQQITSGDGDSAFFRTNECVPTGTARSPATATAPADDTWIGWQHRSLNVGDGSLIGQADSYQVDQDGTITSRELVRFRLRTGDYSHEPAFILESLDITLNDGDGGTITAVAERQGLRLKTGGRATFPNRTVINAPTEIDCPLNAIVPAAVPVLAAAMPHEKNAALALSLLSLRDSISRPGYLLITRGLEPRGAQQHSPTQWRVALLHCGVIVETYRFTDQRRLVQIDSPSGTPLITRRVNSQDEASHPVTQKTAR